MDEYCTKLIFLNQKSRILELYSVKWEYDKSSLDINEYNKLNDGVIEEDNNRYQTQVKAGSNGIAPTPVDSTVTKGGVDLEA